MEQRNLSTEMYSYTQYIDDQTRIIFTWAAYTVLCQAIDIFGVVTNIINIMCFIKQGFKDSVNISLFGLTISDLGCLVTLIWTNMLFTPAVMTANLPFDSLDVMYLTGGMPHITFTRVSSWITAVVTLERCVCVMLPLQARDVITPKRTAGVIVCVITLFVGSGAPVFVVNKLEMKFSPWRNRTLLGIVSSADRESVEKISMFINNFFLPFSAFMVITACTVLLTYSLHKSTKWRKLSTASSQAGVSDKNKKVAKMVVMISTLFIACFLPTTVISVIVAFNLDFTVGGKHLNTGIVLAAFGVILESMNSSSNIFIYYRMSSKYRDTFRSIFYKCRHSGRGPLIPASCE